MILWFGLTSYPVLVPLVGQTGNQSPEGGRVEYSLASRLEVWLMGP